MMTNANRELQIANCKFLMGLLALTLIAGNLDAAPPSAKALEAARERMVKDDIAGAGIKDERVVASIRSTPRHEFMPAAQRDLAYYDMACPIGEGQTISPPFVVAYMTEQLHPQPEDKVLEIGTGSGYQAAVLSPLVKEVYSIEIVKPLGERAARTLKRLGYQNVFTKVGDGYQGWPEHAPFDKIIVTCSPEKVPPKLVEQLREGGRMIVPVGERYRQTLHLFTKQDGKLEATALLPTLFVPMTGAAEARREKLPDPLHPHIANGGFEDAIETSEAVDNDATPQQPKLTPLGWHYQRQMRLVENDDAPEGKNYVTFSNATQGRNAMALQGMAIDGRKVHSFEFSIWVRANRVRPGASDQELPMVMFVFYDENRNEVGITWAGPWSGTFDWKQETEQLDVPPRAREVIVRIGLHGATGEISFDDLKLTPITKRK
jgi:protein-L-isoaspartate(D-aspartate) O-methyltransferase